MISLSRTHVYITQSFCKSKGGQPVHCMSTLLVILLRMSILLEPQKLSVAPNNNCNLDDSLVVWPTEATRVNELHQYRSHATTAGGVKTYLLNRQLFDIKISNVEIRIFLCAIPCCSFELVLSKLMKSPSHVHVLLKLKHLSKPWCQPSALWVLFFLQWASYQS